jgi:hypothetical protein
MECAWYGTINMAIQKFLINFKLRLRGLGKWTLYAIKPWRGLFYTPIVIYSYGKVGSSTVQVSLEKLHLPNPIFHIHFLARDYLKGNEAYLRKSGSDRASHVTEGKILRFFVDCTWGWVHWKIITLVREPVAREISNLFQNPHHFPRLTGLTGDSFVAGAISQIQDTLADFNESTDYTVQWFNVELKDVFGVNVYDRCFDPAKGYAIYKMQNADILLLRSEDLSHCAPQAIQEFLGISDFILLKANEASSKDYAREYRQVVEKINFPPEVLDNIYSSCLAQHFYTDAEISAFKQRWTHYQKLDEKDAQNN